MPRSLKVQHRSDGVAITGSNKTLEVLRTRIAHLSIFPWGHEMGRRRSTRVYMGSDYNRIAPYVRTIARP